MQVSIENAGGLSRRMTVRIPADRVEKAVEDKVRRTGQHAKVPGFRPGKVPYKVLYQRYAESARAEVAGDLVQSTYPEALEREGLKPAGRPRVELGAQSPDQGLSYIASFDVYPEIELKGLDKIKVEKPVAEVTDADIDRTLERLREQHKEFVEAERASADGEAALREKIAESLRREVENAVERRVKSQVLDGLLAANPIDVPAGLVDEEIERMRGEAVARLPEQMRQDPAQVEQLLSDDSLREGAQRRVAMGLLIAEVIAAKDIELDRERVDAKLDELASGYDQQAEAIKSYYRNNPQMMQGIEAMVMEDQVVATLLADAKVKERETGVDELLGGNE